MIRFFISSTFSDMEEEREALHSHIFPEIREYGLEKGVNVDICDLRWGIKSEKDSYANTMKICFQEIDDCRPYLVAMIGDRYGTIASPEQQEKIATLWKLLDRGEDLENILKEQNELQLSLTHWELEFSFLSDRNESTRAICFFRNSPKNEEEAACSSPEEKKKLRALKKKIRAKAKKSNERISYRNYSSRDSFCNMFKNYAKKIIDLEAKSEERNWVEREFRDTDTYSHEIVQGFSGRDRYLTIYEEFITNGDLRVLGFYGSSGIGKSTLMAKLYRQAELKKPSIKKFLILCGATEISNNYLNVLKQIIYVLEKEMNPSARIKDTIQTESSAEIYLREVLDAYNSHQELLFFVDAIDKIDSETKIDLIRILCESKCRSVRMICSQVDKYEESFTNFSMHCIESLEESEIKELIAGLLYNNYQETGNLDQDIVINAVLKKSNVGSPLYLNTVIDILRLHMGKTGDLSVKFKNYANLIDDMPDCLPAICWKGIEETIQFLEKNEGINSKCMEQAVHLIALSKYGLRDVDLEKILRDKGWKTIDFTRLRRYLNRFFRQMDSSCWVYEHDRIKEGILEHFGCSCHDTGDALYTFIVSENYKNKELLMKEGLALSVKYKDLDLARKVLFELASEKNYGRYIERIVANELLESIESSGGESWFRALIDKHVKIVMDALTVLNDGEDYAKIIPAKTVLDYFWQFTGMTSSERIEEWIKKNSPDKALQFSLAELCVQYTNVCESIGAHWRGIDYEFFPSKFFQNEDNIRTLSYDERITVFKHLNSMLYNNNKTLNTVKEISQKIIECHTEGKLRLRKDSAKTIKGKIISNHGQFLNGMERYDEAIKKHIKSLLYKAEMLFEELPKEIEEQYQYKKKFESLCADITFDSIDSMHLEQILAIPIEQHNAFWKCLNEKIKENDIMSREQKKKYKENWKLVAVSYRTICADCFYMDKIFDNSSICDSAIDFGCASIDTSVGMLCNPDIEQSEREILMSMIRRIGIYCKKRDLADEQIEEIKHWIQDAFRKYNAKKMFYGEREGKNLYENIHLLMNVAKNNKKFQMVKELNEISKKLNITVTD